MFNRKEYNKKNMNKIVKATKKWRLKTNWLEKYNKMRKEKYSTESEYREKIRKQRSLGMAKLRKENIEKYREYIRVYTKKRRKNIFHKLNNNFSTGIRTSLKDNKKKRHWEKLVGYSVKRLKKYLEKQFTSEMNWENHGTYWQIDHITPISWFRFDNSEDKQFKLCWSLKNLRPLSKEKNLKKHNNLILENDICKFCLLQSKIDDEDVCNL